MILNQGIYAMFSEPSPSNIKRALVTGATSHLGEKLVNRLLSDGAVVHCLARPSSDLGALENTSAIVHRYDGSYDHMQAIAGEAAPDVVFHLASRYLRTHHADQIDDLIASNVSLGVQLLEALAKLNGCRFINAGSYFQYLDGPEYHPVNLYAATKQAFQDILAYYHEAHDIDVTMLILFDIYSRNDPRPKLMTALRDALKSGSPQPMTGADIKVDLIYIDDVVDALIHSACTDIGVGPYAVSGGTRHSLREVVKVFEDIGQKPINCQWGEFSLAPRTPVKPWDGPSLPGWTARIDLKAGVTRMLKEERS